MDWIQDRVPAPGRAEKGSQLWTPKTRGVTAGDRRCGVLLPALLPLAFWPLVLVRLFSQALSFLGLAFSLAQSSSPQASVPENRLPQVGICSPSTRGSPVLLASQRAEPGASGRMSTNEGRNKVSDLASPVHSLQRWLSGEAKRRQRWACGDLRMGCNRQTRETG